jgi:hypothetical protein
MTAPPQGYKSHVDRLVKRYSGGTSVRQLERDHGLSEGSLSNHISPAKRDGAGGEPKVAKIAIMERFQEVLGAPFEEVSRAFILDAGLTIGPVDVPTPEEAELLDSYRALGAVDKVRLRETAALLSRIAEKFPDGDS